MHLWRGINSYLHRMRPFRHIIPALLLLFLVGASPDILAQKSKKKGKSNKKELSYEDELQARRYFLNASRARLLGNSEEALELFEKCIKIDPNNAAAKFEMGKLYEHLEKTDMAIQMANEAVEIDGNNIWYRFLQADLYLTNNEPEKAAEAYRAAIDIEPDKYEVYFELAQVYLSTGDYEKALKVYDELQAKVGMAEEVIMQRYHVLLAMGEFKQAIDLMQDVIEEYPNDARYHGVLAELYDQVGESEKALQEYKKVLEIDPQNSRIHLALAEHYRVADEEELAYEELKLAYKDPEVDIDTKVQILLNFYDITGHSGVGSSEREDLLAKVNELMDLLVEVHPNNARTFAILGDYQLREGKYKDARESFRKAVELEPDKFVIWQQVIMLSSQLNDQAAVAEESAQAIELFPTMPVFYLYQGIALVQEEKADEAVEALVAGKDLVVEDPQLLAQFYSSLGDAYHAIDDNKRSDENYEQCLRIDPNNIYVLNNYAYYLSVRNEKLDDAEAMSRKSNELQPGQASFQDTYAWILYQQAKYNQAKEWMEKALKNGGQSSGVILEHYGDILYKLGDEDGALEYWLKAKDLGDASDLIEKKISDRQLYE